MGSGFILSKTCAAGDLGSANDLKPVMKLARIDGLRGQNVAGVLIQISTVWLSERLRQECGLPLSK
jgi:hypothetical protein